MMMEAKDILLGTAIASDNRPGTLSRRDFLRLAGSATLGLAAWRFLAFPAEARPPEALPPTIGKLLINGENYPVFPKVADASGRHVLPWVRGFVYWEGLFPDKTLLYAERRVSGKDLLPFLTGKQTTNRLELEITGRGEYDREVKASFASSFLLDVFGKVGEPPTQTAFRDFGSIAGFEVTYDAQKKIKRDPSGQVSLLRPVKILSGNHLVAHPSFQEAPAGAVFGWTCYTTDTTTVGIFQVNDAGVDRSQPVLTIEYPNQYLVVQFNS